MNHEDDTSPVVPHGARDEVRARIIDAAVRLIAEGGVEAATTRAVAAAAGVQAPALYRLFGDKSGLLEAVAEQSMADYVASEGLRDSTHDPVEDLRRSWSVYIAFSTAHPAVFALIYTAPNKPPSAAFSAGLTLLRERVRRIARTGQLQVSEEQAVDLIHSVGTGTALTLLQRPPTERDTLSRAAQDAVFNVILTHAPSAPQSGAVTMATALRASLDQVHCLTPGERHLMDELLERIGRG